MQLATPRDIMEHSLLAIINLCEADFGLSWLARRTVPGPMSGTLDDLAEVMARGELSLAEPSQWCTALALEGRIGRGP